MKSIKNLFALILLSFCLTACVVDETVNALTDVTVSAGSTSITADGTTTLTATAETIGSPALSYTWKIKSGASYASLSSESGQSVTLTGTNTTTAARSVTVKVTASDDTNGYTYSDSVSITVGALGSTDTDSSTSSSTGSNGSTSYDGSDTLYLDLSDGKVSPDNSEWYEISTSKILFTDDTLGIKYTEDDDGNSTGLIKIDATDFTGELNVYISGTMTSGGVKIQSNGSDTVNVTLNGAIITSSNYPCLEVTKGSPAVVTLSGTNSFTDGRSYGTGYGAYYTTDSSLDGTAYDTDDNYVYCASGKIETEGSDSKGTLYCKGSLTLNGSGSLAVTQGYKNCIATKEGLLTINGGTFTLQNYTTSTSNPGKNGLYGATGIVVNDGTISFTGYGLISKSSSYYELRKANGFKTDDDTYTSSYITIAGGTTTVTTYNGKGMTAPKITISGGTNTFTVTGTTSYSESSASGSYYDADGVKQTGTIKFAPEGIEGDSSVSISGGTTIVSAPDDGINVSNTGGTLTISGGTVYVRAEGDGLDSNGNITISGGVTVVSQTGNGNSPIDCGDNYKFTVTGTSATVFAMGDSAMFSESIPSSTVSPMIYSTSLGTSTSSLAAGGIIGLSSPQSYAAAILISSSLTSGTSYSFVKGGTLSGTEYFSGTGIYFPVSVSGGSSTSATATTSSSSSSSSGPGGNSGPGGR